MDTTKTITHVSLCAGYGGIDLGLSRAVPNLRTIAFSEIEAFACANLVAKMEAGLLEPAPIWTNLKTFPWESFRDRVDILSGGYPCQPFSAAGKRLGRNDPRHLWPFIADGIRILRPQFCFFENVEGHISLGLREVISELEGLGYQTTWGIFSAREVGAPHQRKRVFILAYDKRQRIEELGRQITVGSQQHSAWDDGDDAWPSRPGEPQHAWEPPRVVANSILVGRGRRSDGDAGGMRGEIQVEGSCGSGAEEAMANNNSAHAGHGEQRPERTFGDLSGGCGEAMGNATHGSNGQQPTEQQGWNTSGRSGEESAVVGNTVLHGHATSEVSGSISQSEDEGWMQKSKGRSASMADNLRGRLQNATDQQRNSRADDHAIIRTCPSESGNGQTQPPLGGDADGTASRMDYAELCVSCDNRTDELRLLGNGVVPATATRAFLTLMDQLLNENA